MVALRWNSGLSLGGRSSCPSCGKVLRWWELAPLLSFLLLRGRCRRCQARIPYQYLLIELWTGLFFAPLPFLMAPVFSLYTVILIYDFRHKIIPDALVYPSVALALLAALAGGPYSLLDWLAGPILAIFLGGLWLITRGRAIGLGDAKLALSIGLLLGAAQGFSALVVAFWMGALVGILLIVKSAFNPLLSGGKKITMKSELPLAPFLVFGAWLSLVLHLNLLYVSSSSLF